MKLGLKSMNRLYFDRLSFSRLLKKKNISVNPWAQKFISCPFIIIEPETEGNLDRKGNQVKPGQTFSIWTVEYSNNISKNL